MAEELSLIAKILKTGRKLWKTKTVWFQTKIFNNRIFTDKHFVIESVTAVLSFDFNGGSSNSSGGDLVFRETNGFQVTFSDDHSNGYSGGNADWVHVTNRGYGNVKVGHPTLT